MAERKTGRVIFWQNLSRILAIFRLQPEESSQFPDYLPGRYIALRREDCKLTKKVVVDGVTRIEPLLDENGNQKFGPVTHSYSISSAPFETKQNGYLEFYVVLEKDNEGHPGRLTESLFHINLETDNQVTYFDRITGDFTLDKRAGDAANIIFVGTGTGLAPFASMLKQVHHEADNGKKDNVRYTLFHANRTLEELAYHQVLQDIEKSGVIDFVYIPTVSRPTERDLSDPHLGTGRANNVLRHVFGMPLREEQDLENVRNQGIDPAEAQAILDRTTKPELPSLHSIDQLRKRMTAGNSVILTCGNPNSMADIKFIAESNQIRFEKEDW